MFKNEIEVALSNEKRRSDFESKLTSKDFKMCRLTIHGEAVTAFALEYVSSFVENKCREQLDFNLLIHSNFKFWVCGRLNVGVLISMLSGNNSGSIGMVSV